MATPYAGNFDTGDSCINPFPYFMAYAQHALVHTKNVLKYGAINKISDQVKYLLKPRFGFPNPFQVSLFSPTEAVVLQRSERLLRRGIWGMDTQEEADFMARRAATYGAGNCGEHAAVAYAFLKEQNVKPIAFMAFANSDHAFVLLGYGPQSNEAEPYTWGPDAVICDPWGDEVYPAVQFYSHVKSHDLRPEVWDHTPDATMNSFLP